MHRNYCFRRKQHFFAEFDAALAASLNVITTNLIFFFFHKILMNVHQENMIVVIIYCAPTIMVDIDVIVQEVTERVCPNDTALVSSYYVQCIVILFRLLLT